MRDLRLFQDVMQILIIAIMNVQTRLDEPQPLTSADYARIAEQTRSAFDAMCNRAAQTIEAQST